jgi:hypothetical protein
MQGYHTRTDGRQKTTIAIPVLDDSGIRLREREEGERERGCK